MKTVGVDLGTYHVKIELQDGRGWYHKWETGGRFVTGGTAEESPLTAQWMPPTYENEDDLVSSIIFMFEQGNYSCDCNKSLFLLRAYNQDGEELPCGDTLLIKRITLIRPDGTETLLVENP